MRNFILLGLLFFPYLVFCQNINGKVLDENEKGVPFANLLFLDMDSTFIKGEITLEDGTFSMTLDESKTYILQVSSVGYQTIELTLNAAMKKESLLILLKTDNQLLEEVSVVVKKPLFVQEIDRTIVNVQNSVISKGANVLELIEKSPGVTVDRINQRISLQGRDGLIIAINGKQVRQDGGALFQMLEGTPSANVSNIELIHNPPASYDAQGNAGVININLIKQEDFGFNGNLSTKVGYGQRPKFGSSLLMNYKVKKINIYTEINLDHNFTNQDATFEQNVLFPSGRLVTDLDNKRKVSLGFHTGKLGIDYSLSPKIEWSSFVSGSLRRWDMEALGDTKYIGAYDSILEDELISQEKNYTDHFMWSNRLTFKLDEKSSLSFDYDYLKYEANNPTEYQLHRTFTDDSTSVEAFNSTKHTPNDFHVSRMDYRRELNGKIELETGLKLTIAQVQNTTALNFTVPEIYTNPFFDEDVDLREDTYATYASFKIQWSENISLLAGIRYEYNLLNLNSKIEGPLIDRKRGQLFPTINLSRKWENSSITLSYNRRVSRPSFQILAPSFYFLDTRTLLTGNINVLPTTSDNIGLQLSFGSVSASLRYTNQQKPVAGAQPEFIEEEAQFLLRPRNIDQRQLFTANISLPLNFTKIWTARLNLNSTYLIDYFNYEGQSMSTDGFTVDGNLTTNLLLPNAFELELSFRGNTRGYSGLITFEPRLLTSIGVSKKFKNDWRLSLNWVDLFDKGSFFGLTTRDFNDDVYYKWLYQFEGNIFRLTANIPFGNLQAKKDGRKATGSDDIQNRARN